MAGGLVLILAITCIVFLVKGMKGGKDQDPSVESEGIVAETELKKKVQVNGVDITGMSREEAKTAILKEISWGMKVTWEDQSMDVTDLMAEKVNTVLDEIYQNEPKEMYTVDASGLEEAVKEEAAKAAAKWDKKPKNGSISSYDASKDKFIFSGSENGIAVNQEKLVSDIQSALNAKDYDAVIPVSAEVVAPEFDEAAARERYEMIGSFTTKTTANKKRNTNVRLSAEAINGVVIQPGQEFSFNEVVGERTAEKGYQGAAAYNNGEVVEEIGGGVCQTSSTLYNAVVKAGLKTTVRRSHTYEPSYVTPGTDATVSWGGPDYKFVNNTTAGIGIRARYADQTITISIYGIPILEEGETRSLKSTKLKDMDLPEPTYEEDPTLEPGTEKVKSAGSQGSRWETRLVIKKNGEVVSEEVDHHVTYKGHAPVILRNTSGTMTETVPGEGSEGIIDPSQSTPAPEGAGDGLHQGTESAAPSGGAAEKPTKPSSDSQGSSASPEQNVPDVQERPGGTVPSEPEMTQGTVSQPGAAPGTESSAPSDAGIQTIAPNPGR